VIDGCIFDATAVQFLNPETNRFLLCFTQKGKFPVLNPTDQKTIFDYFCKNLTKYVDIALSPDKEISELYSRLLDNKFTS